MSVPKSTNGRKLMSVPKSTIVKRLEEIDECPQVNDRHDECPQVNDRHARPTETWRGCLRRPWRVLGRLDPLAAAC